MSDRFAIRFTDRDGIAYRSYPELLFARVLTENGVPFTYEPRLLDAHGCHRMPDFLISHEKGFHGACIEISSMWDDPSYLAGWLRQGPRGRCSRISWYASMAGRYWLYPVEKTDSEAYYDRVARRLQELSQGDLLLRLLSGGTSADWAQRVRSELETRLELKRQLAV